MYDGYFESPAQIQARFDRIKANMAQIRLRDEIIKDVSHRLNLLLDVCGDIDDQNGALLPIESGGVDAVDAQRWQDAPEYKEAQQVSDKFNFDTVAEQEF